MHSYPILEERLKALGWRQTAQQLDELVESASANTLSYFDFLDTLVKQDGNIENQRLWQNEFARQNFRIQKRSMNSTLAFSLVLVSNASKRLVPAALSQMEKTASYSAHRGWARHISPSGLD